MYITYLLYCKFISPINLPAKRSKILQTLVTMNSDKMIPASYNFNSVSQPLPKETKSILDRDAFFKFQYYYNTESAVAKQTYFSHL